MLVRKGRESSIARGGPSSDTDDKIAAVMSGPSTPRPRPRTNLNQLDRFVRVPIGLLWLVVLAIIAVPLLIYMTLLYWVVQGTLALFGKNRTTRADRSGGQERVA
jgi:hypothetical protein